MVAGCFCGCCVWHGACLRSDEEAHPGFGNQFIFGYEVEVELPIQLENGNEVEYE